jgi:serine/threonine-protein kinase RsbW
MLAEERGSDAMTSLSHAGAGGDGSAPIHFVVTKLGQTTAMKRESLGSIVMHGESLDREIVMHADTGRVTGVRDEVVSSLEAAGYPEESAFEVGVALVEALTNAIVHGCRNDPKHRVRVRLRCNASGIELTVRDPGEGFDPGQLPNPVSVEALIAQSGRGIQMMRSYMDQIVFENGGREVRMYKKWPVRQEAQSA